MKYSERILEELLRMAERDKGTLFDAATQYCTEHDIDEEKFIKSLDPVAILRIKKSAIEDRKVRRCVETLPHALI